MGTVSGRATLLGLVLGGGLFGVLSASGFDARATAGLLDGGPRINAETAKWCLSLLTAVVPMAGSWLESRFPAIGAWRRCWRECAAAGALAERLDAVESRLAAVEESRTPAPASTRKRG